MDMGELDEEESLTSTWDIDPSGTMRHKKTGTKVSSESGITFQGKEYSLSVSDIELEGGDALGAGAGGVVLKGFIKKTGQKIAVKTVKFDDKAKRDQLLNELRGLVLAENCPYLVQWYAGFANKKTNGVYVCLELMDLGSLRDLHKRSPGGQVPPYYLAGINFQVMMGLQHLHHRHMLHRDIKPENILHNTFGQVKLTDFGIAKDLDATLAMADTFVGTATYMSPERCLGNDYNFSSDIWSVGMVLYELATGRYPFADCSSFPALFDSLCEQPEPRLPDSYPRELAEFAAMCLTRDVPARPDTDSLLRHPFVTVNVPPNEALAQYLATLMPGGKGDDN